MSAQAAFQESLDKQVNSLIESYVKEVVNRNLHQVNKHLTERIDHVLKSAIGEKIQDWDFPDSSIPSTSINWQNFSLSANAVQGYRALNGIEDHSKEVELTILDGAVVAENSVYTKQVVTENLAVNGDFHLSDIAYNSLRDRIANSITIPDIPTIPEIKDWSFKIAEMDAKIEVNSKRQENLRQLDVSGEAYLSETLYTTPGNNRVGINTMDPSDALTVWDQEVEVVVGKHKSQEGYIGTRRRQDVNIGANNRVGITVTSDGSVKIDKLTLMNRVISESDQVPGNAAKTGDIVLNTKPKPGGYIGWVCLDGIKWSGFGKIE